MPRRKLTPELWERLFGDYVSWDPSEPDAPSIDDVVAPYGISKVTFYNEMRRRGLPLKGQSTPVPAPDNGGTAALIELLVEARLRIAVLERLLRESGIQPPA